LIAALLRLAAITLLRITGVGIGVTLLLVALRGLLTVGRRGLLAIGRRSLLAIGRRSLLTVPGGLPTGRWITVVLLRGVAIRRLYAR
jgi:hypothetical protein